MQNEAPMEEQQHLRRGPNPNEAAGVIHKIGGHNSANRP